MTLNNNIDVQEIPEIEKVIPITPAQMEIWLACKIGGREANKAYNESVALRLSGDLSVKYLQNAFLQVIERHEGMRSVVSPNGRSLIVFSSFSLPIRMRDISEVGEKEKDVVLKKHLEQRGSYHFNLVQGPLYVMDLIKLEEKSYLLTFTGHHLIFDGWSLGVMLEELAVIYSSLIEGRDPKLPKADGLGDYAKEFFNLTRKSSYKETKDFWKNYLSNPVPRLDLPIDKERTKIRTYNSDVHRKFIEVETLKKVKVESAKLNSSLNLTLLAIFELFISDWTKQNDIIVGLPVAGQIGFNKHRLIGHCVSLLPLRSRIDKNQTFSEYLKIRKSDYNNTLEHSLISFGDMIQNIPLTRDPSRISLVPVTFNIDTGMEEGLEFTGLEHNLMANPKSFSNFELILNLFKSANGYVLDFTYNSNLFNKSTIITAADKYFKMIDLFLDHREKKISEIFNLFSSKSEVTQVPIIEFQSLGELIKVQLSSREDKVAVQIGSEEFTYKQLNTLVNAIAVHLIFRGAGPGKVVGVHMERGINLIAGALAVIRIGACYMPIDTEFPEERVKYMLDDADVKVFITENDTYSWGDLNAKKLKVDHEVLQKPTPDFVSKFPKPDDPIFIVYTSGSTGNPKGVVLTQLNLVDFLKHFKIAPGINEQDRVMGLTSISFDMSFLELILPFVFGASLYLLDKYERRDPREIVKVVKSAQITKLFATPSHLKSIVNYGLTDRHDKLTIISAGEPLQLSLARKLVQASSKVFNIYGPTETTIFSTIKEITADTQVITIGKPVEGTSIVLVDDSGRLVNCLGKAGEVYIGGKGIGQGYLNNKKLTEEKFITGFQEGFPGVYYKTGDLAIWTSEGELDCKGRVDHQVKIRGQRIELGEVESAISQDKNVLHVLLEKQISEDGSDILVAFVAFKKTEGRAIDFSMWINSCKTKLSSTLPSFMVPAQFYIVENFQINQNGKIERTAEKIIIHNNSDEIKDKKIPTSTVSDSDVKKGIKELWGKVLNTTNPNLDSDFFQEGGHSLLAVDLISQIEKKFSLTLPLSLLFEYTTINTIANYITQLLSSKAVDNMMVKIKEGNSKKVLFFIHGVGLNPLEIKTLNNHMDEDQTIWGLQSPAIMNNGIAPIDNIEDIAKLYINKIKDVGFNGPYSLLGNSFGGQIAFEMAKQLIESGAQVSFLGMIDTIASLKEDHPKGLIDKLHYFAKKLVFDIKFMFDDPIYYLLYRREYMREKFDNYNNHSLDNASSSLKERIKIIEDINMLAWRNYSHKHIDASITLFLAKKKTFFVHDFVTFGWSPYVNNVEVVYMPGEHANMLKPPNGVEFSKVLQNILNKSNY
ncbi:non-ribosomal peptide synthetase [Algoriphagus antarcticus]|uniref:Amino acid adenylation domain-containing protein n=1 Tax=Algoriphagus antarcticus TaxID=238540 RepID=A0A3E0D5U2_9BACT|nr:non-ribosomal peptide synthetase [Algoriphagus antarcticus]REG76918.1 amino acid adenylation domain-containing protein [Algoriphagus antarcticus]